MATAGTAGPSYGRWTAGLRDLCDRELSIEATLSGSKIGPQSRGIWSCLDVPSRRNNDRNRLISMLPIDIEITIGRESYTLGPQFAQTNQTGVGQ